MVVIEDIDQIESIEVEYAAVDLKGHLELKFSEYILANTT